MSPAPASPGRRTLLVATWAVGVIAVGFVEAIARLGARAWETVSAGLTPLHQAALVGVIVAFVYGEGMRALARRFVPHVVERAFRAGDDVSLRAAVLAPAFAMSLHGASPRSVARAWAGVALIVVAVFLVRALPEPWRGIVDAGVASALSWGLGALVLRFLHVVRSGRQAR